MTSSVDSSWSSGGAAFGARLDLALAGRSPRARRRASADGGFFLGLSSFQSMASSSPPTPRRAMRTGVLDFVGAEGGACCTTGAASGVAAFFATSGVFAGDGAAFGDGAKRFASKRSSDSSSAGRTISVPRSISSSKSGLATGVVDLRSFLRGWRSGVGSCARRSPSSRRSRSSRRRSRRSRSSRRRSSRSSSRRRSRSSRRRSSRSRRLGGLSSSSSSPPLPLLGGTKSYASRCGRSRRGLSRLGGSRS
mmetsp:Transcript_13862/g.36822  ORF Transcript_13862/g.36822 Transcript_13862/m.36822 type:complete len:250 (+) Transcript_13862:405-1154(+)